MILRCISGEEARKNSNYTSVSLSTPCRWDLRKNGSNADLVAFLTEHKKRTEDVTQSDPHKGLGAAGQLQEWTGKERMIQCAQLGELEGP